MGLFRRREPLHERLAREGRLTEDAPPPDPRPAWQETGIHGVHRAREWDATVTAEAPEIAGDAVRFVALSDGTLLVEEGPDDSLEPLAAAVEQVIAAPYRARAVRQSESLWAVQAKRIELVEIANRPDGETIVLTPDELLVDGERAFGSVPELENRGDVVRASRLDGDLWEVQAGRL